MIRVPALTLTFAGGLNENEKPRLDEAAEGSYNFDLMTHEDDLNPRRPFDLMGTATNNSAITGFAQLVKKTGSNTTLVTAGTAVYLWDGSTFTSKGSVTAPAKLRDVYWALDDYLLLTDINLNNVVKKWDGTTLADATTGLGAALYAKYGIEKDNRIWLFNIKSGSTPLPHMIVVSKFEDPAVFDTSQRAITGTFSTGLEAFYMYAPDLRPINGAVLFQDQLIISTQDGRLFKLTGTDAKTYKWVDFYSGSAAIGDESIANVGNDVMYMRKGGNITTLSAVQSFGDVKAEDLSRWIPKTVSNLTSCIVCYDQVNAKVYFFLGNGKVLVFYKDLYFNIPGVSQVDERVNALSPWSLWRTGHASNFSAAAVKFMYQPGTTTYGVYFGDSAGRIFLLDGVGANGDGGTTAIQMVRKTTSIDKTLPVFGPVNPFPWGDNILTGDVQYKRVAPQFDLSIAFQWVDEYNTSTSVVPIKGPPASDSATGAYWNGTTAYWNASMYWNQGFSFSGVASHQSFSPTGKSEGGFTLTFSTQTNGRYQIDNVALYA